MTEAIHSTGSTNGHGTTQEVLVLRDASFDPRAAAPSVPMRTLVRAVLQSLLVVVVCAAAAVGFAMTQPKIRGGEVNIIYEPSAEASSSVQADRELATQQVIVKGRSVLEPVARAEHMSVERLEKATDVEVIPGTEVLRVTVARRSGSQARRIAQKIADTYIGQATGATGRSLEGTLTAQRAQLADAQANVESATTQEDTAKYETLVDTLLRKITSVESQLASLPPAGNAQGTPRLLDTAHLLTSPVSPKPARAAGFGALIGLVIAAAMSYVILSRSKP